MQTSANGHSRADWAQSIAGQWYLQSLARGLEGEKGDGRPHFAGQIYLWSQRNRPCDINLHHWPQHASDSSGRWPGMGKNDWPSDSGHISQLMWPCLDWVCCHSGQPTNCFISLFLFSHRKSPFCFLVLKPVWPPMYTTGWSLNIADTVEPVIKTPAWKWTQQMIWKIDVMFEKSHTHPHYFFLYWK